MGDISQTIRELLSSPPGLPHPQPSTSSWQVPPHPTVCDRQSTTLPTAADVVIIGSGITGCAVAHTLLNSPSAANLKICVLEARQAVSGATGRNGGHLISDSASLVAPLAEALGDESAASLIKFSEANIKRIKKLVAGFGKDDQRAAELRELVAMMAVQDANMFADTERGNALATKLYPESVIKTGTMPTAEAKTAGYRHDLHGAVEQHGAAALWPYRLVTKLFEELLERHSSHFSLETNTPALSIDFVGGDDAQYHIITPRGTIRTKKIVHCTNGFTGHLLPRLIGTIYPFRGTMSVQEPGPEFPRVGDRISWSWLRKPTFDADTQVFSTGLYYAQQNAHTGKLFIGGERQKIADMLSSDDSVVAEEARESLLSVLPQLLNNVEPVGEQIVWSGIMGFSSDGLPLAGKLEESVTGRGGDGEWIAAGFNGHGMDKCWLTGVAVAQMVMGQPETVGLPAAFLLTSERRKRIGLEQSVEYWLQTLSQST